MSTLQKLNLDTCVPPLPGMTVRLRYQFDGEFGDALLFRGEADPAPVQISAPSGEVEVLLPTPQTLFLQVLDGSAPISVSVIGYALP